MSRGCPAWAQGEGGLRHQDPAALARHLDLVVPVTQRRLPFGDRSVEVDVAAKPTIGSVLLFVTLVPLAALGGFPPRFSLNDEGLDRLDGRIIVRSFHAAFLVWSVFFASVHVDVLVVHIRVDVDVAPSIDKPIFISDLADNALAFVEVVWEHDEVQHRDYRHDTRNASVAEPVPPIATQVTVEVYARVEADGGAGLALGVEGAHEGGEARDEDEDDRDVVGVHPAHFVCGDRVHGRQEEDEGQADRRTVGDVVADFLVGERVEDVLEHYQHDREHNGHHFFHEGLLDVKCGQDLGAIIVLCVVKDFPRRMSCDEVVRAALIEH
mmetsp:Transcript_41424/g.95712  ORF Transcript_41424/g.95712 Transcript_41424/m.95712 type:complete len:324 (-) Transcript_41424:2058-3029(-)